MKKKLTSKKIILEELQKEMDRLTYYKNENYKWNEIEKLISRIFYDNEIEYNPIFKGISLIED